MKHDRPFLLRGSANRFPRGEAGKNRLFGTGF